MFALAIALLVLAAFAASSCANGKVSASPPPTRSGHAYYVSTSGNDANAGTATSPFRTLAKGVSVLRPGDTLYVRGGTYLLRPNGLRVGRSGRASAPITISGYPGETAVISGDTNGSGTADVGDTPANRYGSLVRIAGNYVTFKNIEVCFSGGRGIETIGRRDVIYGCNVHHIWNIGIYLDGLYNTAQGNTVWRAADSNFVRGANGDWSAGIAWGYSKARTPPGSAPYARIVGNTVYHNSGEGILGMHTDYGLVKGNICYDNWAVTGIYPDQCSYTTVEGNLVYWTGDTFWSRFSSGVSGILLSNEGIGGAVVVGHDNKVISNIVVGCSSNINFWNGSLTGSALVNTLIANNTSVNATGASISIEAGNGADHVNSRIANNLVLETSGTLGSIESSIGLTFDHNLWSLTPAAAVSSPTDVIGAPLLLDPSHVRSPGQVAAAWYQLAGTSPARGRGISLPGVPDDFFGSLRNDPPDIGAHQYKP